MSYQVSASFFLFCDLRPSFYQCLGVEGLRRPNPGRDLGLGKWCFDMGFRTCSDAMNTVLWRFHELKGGRS